MAAPPSEKIRPDAPLRTLDTAGQRWAVGLFGWLILALFFRAGLSPLILEEPRRALIALEMIFNGNWLVPTEFGELYHKKPPFFNWVIIAGYYLTGTYSEWAVRGLSLLSFLAMGGLVYAMGQRYVSRTFGLYAGLLTLTMADILYYFSFTAGEINLFYSLVTLGSFFTIFHFYERQQPYVLFVSTYLLGAIGTLTMGLPSPVFLALSLGSFFAWHRDWRGLLSGAHAVGIGVYVLVVGGYLYGYSRYHDPLLFVVGEETLLSQASERTVFENQLTALLTHLVRFPLQTLQNVAPASLLLLFVAAPGIGGRLRRNGFIRFVLLMLAANVLVYWLSPGTRSRYVYMLYPLVVMVLTYAYLAHPVAADWRTRVLPYVTRGLLVAFGLAMMSLPAWPPNVALPHPWTTAVLATLVTGSLLWFHLRRPQYTLLQLIALAILARVVLTFTFLPIRATESRAAQDKRDGLRIAALTAEAPLHLYGATAVSRTLVFYVERERQQVLGYADRIAPGAYLLAESSDLPPGNCRVVYQFEYQNQPRWLLQCP